MLTTLRVDASIFLHASFCQDWVIDINAFDVATFHLISRGDCWLHLPEGVGGAAPVPLHEGDLLVLPHNAYHLITHSPEPPAEQTPRNTPATELSGPSATLICGTVAFSQNYWNPLIEALPEYVILPTADSTQTTLGNAIEALINECERGEAGSEVIINRLSDILFIEVLRSYITKQRGDRYLLAITDPKLSRSLEAFHEEPGDAWSVQELAERANMSRSAFAERFQKLVGVAPMSYVTRWRMHFAHNRLLETDESIGDIAESCGYLSEGSFTKAFRKEFGVSPRAVRRRDSTGEVSSELTVGSGSGTSTKVMYSPLEANQLRLGDAALFVDVRDAERYQRGHISGAVNIPEVFSLLSMTTAAGLKDMQTRLYAQFTDAGITPDKTILFYEDNLASCYGASCRGYFQLSLFGHPNLGLLDGGLERWQAEGYPVDTHTPDRIRSILPDLPLRREALATIDDVMHALEHPEIKLLDNRDREEWLGITSSPSEFYADDFLPRRGRIPGARWIEWRSFMETSDGYTHFKSAEQIRALCAQAGLYPDDDIIVYCFKGARSSNTWLAMKLAGFKHVRNYYGSWNEWSRNAALPAMSVRLMG
jgi:thiosulfate/3-mercaptopyruvate sulfurtransferase